MLWNVLRFVDFLFQIIRIIKYVSYQIASLLLLLIIMYFIILPQDAPECMKYFYKEKVPELGASTPGAARLCQRFVNR